MVRSRLAFSCCEGNALVMRGWLEGLSIVFYNNLSLDMPDYDGDGDLCLGAARNALDLSELVLEEPSIGLKTNLSDATREVSG